MRGGVIWICYFTYSRPPVPCVHCSLHSVGRSVQGETCGLPVPGIMGWLAGVTFLGVIILCRCLHSEKKYGPPSVCEHCNTRCAFPKPVDVKKKVGGLRGVSTNELLIVHTDTSGFDASGGWEDSLLVVHHQIQEGPVQEAERDLWQICRKFCCKEASSSHL